MKLVALQLNKHISNQQIMSSQGTSSFQNGEAALKLSSLGKKGVIMQRYSIVRIPFRREFAGIFPSHPRALVQGRPLAGRDPNSAWKTLLSWEQPGCSLGKALQRLRELDKGRAAGTGKEKATEGKKG